MDESELPTGETEGLPQPEPWVMPEPMFRSTPGSTPGIKPSDPQAEIETEPIGFIDDPDTAKPASQSVRVKEEDRTSRHKKKKGGCAKFFTLLAVLVGLVIGVGIAAAIYFIFYWRPSSTVF